MNYYLYFTISGLIILILLTVVYFSKEKLETFENKIYSVLLVCTLLSGVVEISMFFTCKVMDTMPIINTIAAKGYLVVIEFWVLLLCYYTFYISTKKESKTPSKQVIVLLIGIYIICAVTTLILPIYYYFPEGFSNYTYTYGPSTKMVFITGMIYILISMYFILKKKRFFSKNNLPVYCYILLSLIIAIFQQINPQATFISYAQIFIAILMYFTIENPDLKMLKELSKNKKLIEKSNDEFSKFSFRITQDLRKPIKEIIDVSSQVDSTDKKEDLIKEYKYINQQADNANFLINKALNIGNMDTTKIKIYDSKYNTYNLFKEISLKAEEEIKASNKFIWNLSSNMPTYLYGDSIKLKQILSGIIKIANEFTDNGFINLDINTIIKYNICRLIINIEDSGKGISLDRVNEILSITEEKLKSVDIDSDETLDIFAIKKLIQMLGGSIMIISNTKSDDDDVHGTRITIVLDQKIVPSEESEIAKKLESYEQSLYNEKKVLIIDNDEEEIDKIAKILKQENFIIDTSLYERDVIEKIKSKLKYDLIILDDEMREFSALAVLQELKKEHEFNTPVVIMINNNKEGIKLHYLKDGFYDCISKTKLDSEVKRIANRIK